MVDQDSITGDNDIGLECQDSAPPTSPRYVLRGHGAAIHAVRLFARNLRLVSGDADGWVVVWDMVTKRAVVSWKAHEGAVLEVKGFQFGSSTEIYTHGKDHKLCVWRFHADDEPSLNKVLPLGAAQASDTGRLPPLACSLPVNALNFCALSLLFLGSWNESRPIKHNWVLPHGQKGYSSTSGKEGTGDYIEHKPVLEKGQKSEIRQATLGKGSVESLSIHGSTKLGIPSLIAVPNTLNSGAIDIYHLPSKRRVSTIPKAETETGMLMAVNIFTSRSDNLCVAASYEDGHVMLFVCRDNFRTSDIAQNNGPCVPWSWDKVYSHKSHKQPALSLDVSPCRTYFLTSAADSLLVKHPVPEPGPANASLSSTTVTSQFPLDSQRISPAGKESLRIRSDGLIFATACWNDTVQVYRCGTLKPIASLSWRKEGCRAVAFGEVDLDNGSSTGPLLDSTCVPRALTLADVQRRRSMGVQYTHWLATGSKEGKISLWDIY